MSNPLLFTTNALIQIEGVNSDVVTISGYGEGMEGVYLDTSPEALIDPAPIKGIWTQSAFEAGATYLGHRVEPLDMVLSFSIYADNGDYESTETRFLRLFAYDKPAKIVVTSMGETRSLEVVLFQSPKFDTKYDPHWHGFSKVTMTLRAAFPYWRAETHTQTINGTGTVRLWNECDVPLWPVWVFTGGSWVIPDGNGTVSISDTGELVVRTYPTSRTYSRSDVARRMRGVEPVNPIPPHSTEVTKQVRRTSGSGTCTLYLTEYFSRPWGGRS